jgi:hypothetical protein
MQRSTRGAGARLLKEHTARHCDRRPGPSYEVLMRICGPHSREPEPIAPVVALFEALRRSREAVSEEELNFARVLI